MQGIMLVRRDEKRGSELEMSERTSGRNFPCAKVLEIFRPTILSPLEGVISIKTVHLAGVSSPSNTLRGKKMLAQFTRLPVRQVRLHSSLLPI
jgi:hypothetical protein